MTRWAKWRTVSNLAEGAAGAPREEIDGMPDPTRVEGADDFAEPDESATAPAPVRWSGAAPVPESRKKRRLAQDDPEEDDWGTMPAVDPWADQDTPWALIPPPAPGPVDLPPTRLDGPGTGRTATPALGSPALGTPPPTRVDGVAHPPTRLETAVPGAAAPSPSAVAGPTPVAGGQKAAAPLHAVPVQKDPVVKRSGWGWRKPAPKPQPAPAASPTAAPAPAPAPAPNRIPIQSRPQPYAAPQPYAPPQPYAAPPQSYAPPAGTKPAIAAKPAGTKPPPTMPPPRRRRKWPRRLLVLGLLGAVCCCGIPGYFAWPAAQQYQVTAALPASVRDLSLRDDSASRKAVDKLTQQLGDSGLTGHQAFAGIYADGNGKRVTVFGTTGWRTDPGQDVKTEVDRLATDYKITGVAPYDLGETGAHERCGVGRANGAGVVVCVWADHGSLATVLLTRRNVTESAELVGVLRSAVLTRG
jgi:hypothetical protein